MNTETKPIDLNTARERVIERLARQEVEADQARIARQRAAKGAERANAKRVEAARAAEAAAVEGRTQLAALRKERAALFASLVENMRATDALAVEVDARQVEAASLRGSDPGRSPATAQAERWEWAGDAWQAIVRDSLHDLHFFDEWFARRLLMTGGGRR